MMKEKINLPLNSNSKSANIKKNQIKTENFEEKKQISAEKINGDPTNKVNNQQTISTIHSNKKFKEMKKKIYEFVGNRR